MKSEVFWSKMAKSYDKNTFTAYQKTYEDTIRSSKKYLNTDCIAMDIGCGTGITTVALASSVKELYAIDTSEAMIGIAKEKAQNSAARNVRFYVADIFDKRWEINSFDVVMAFNILCYIEDRASFLARVYGLLQPGGVFLSATDCFGETKNASAGLRTALNKLHILPYAKNFRIRELEETVLGNKFEILESVNLHVGVPNLFIAAKKRAD
jgi:ubiquinone/menaquinone biosynthesis C-methylase UbiE